MYADDIVESVCDNYYLEVFFFFCIKEMLKGGGEKNPGDVVLHEMGSQLNHVSITQTLNFIP